ncbi:hypothetical protein FOCC_FOCC006572, partial [Frankliniella occidentalis]
MRQKSINLAIADVKGIRQDDLRAVTSLERHFDVLLTFLFSLGEARADRVLAVDELRQQVRGALGRQCQRDSSDSSSSGNISSSDERAEKSDDDRVEPDINNEERVQPDDNEEREGERVDEEAELDQKMPEHVNDSESDDQQVAGDNVNINDSSDEGDNANLTAEEKEAYLKQSLQEWATSGGVLSRIKIDELLDISMDGLPPSKDSSCKKFWPILGKLVNSVNEPFAIAIYCGAKDPRDVDTFLGDLVVELD